MPGNMRSEGRCRGWWVECGQCACAVIDHARLEPSLRSRKASGSASDSSSSTMNVGHRSSFPRFRVPGRGLVWSGAAKACGIARVKVDPVPGHPHRDSARWLAATCRRSPSPVRCPAGHAGAGLVDAEEPLEARSWSVASMPMPRSVTATATIGTAAVVLGSMTRRLTETTGPRGRVGDRVEMRLLSAVSSSGRSP